MTDKVKLSVYIDRSIAEALHRASLEAGGYGQKSRIVENALQKHLNEVKQTKGGEAK